jgi:hypothetical protein
VPPPDPEGDIDPYRPSTEAAIELQAVPVRPIRFPVGGAASVANNFGACRDGCTRRHQGVDIFARKLTPLLAAMDGHVTWLRTDASGTAGNGVGITDAGGWRYLYLHVNNDTPGTDDGRNPARWRFAPVVRMGAKVYQGQLIGYVGDSGNAETTPSHVHFEIRTPDLVNINPYPSVINAHRRPPAPRLYRFDAPRGGAADDHVQFGSTTTNAVLGCDVDANGVDEPVYRVSQTFRIAVAPDDLRIRWQMNYGSASDRAFCGDWDGDGIATPGVRRGQLVLLRNSWASGPASLAYAYGAASDQIVVGDWNGDGVDTLAAVRGSLWLLTNRHGGGTASASFMFGRAGDRAIAGDFNADGLDTAGVRRGSSTFLRLDPGGGTAQRQYDVGLSTDRAVVAKWRTRDVDEVDSVSLWRRSPP